MRAPRGDLGVFGVINIMSEAAAVATTNLDTSGTRARLLLPITIFLGALLLFGVEPMIAKMILPWFGGSAEVWIVCLLFFQAALLGGYLYAHLLNTRIPAQWQVRVHLALLAVSLVFLPIVPADRWKPLGGEDPLLLILGVLTSTIGLPFVLLASTGPLIQAWHSRVTAADSSAGHSVYRLYALSNAGSLIALLSYPVLVEPWLPTRMQALSWSVAYVCYAVLFGSAAWLFGRASESTPDDAAGLPDTTIGRKILWFLLAMMPSALLLAVTNFMLRNIAAIPLLWVVPLALYLLTLIIAFDSPRWFWRPFWYVLFAAVAETMMYNVIGPIVDENYFIQLAFFSGGLFVYCMMCHGELASMRPPAAQLTSYYLLVAAGGAAGGLLVAVIAPIAYSDDFDLALLLPAAALLLIFIGWRQMPADAPRSLRWGTLALILYAWGSVAVRIATQIQHDESGNLLSARNFYGPLLVTQVPVPSTKGDILQLRNGNVIHGREFIDRDLYCEPISYYGRTSGIGLAIAEKRSSGPLKIGVVGLGSGAIAGYGQDGDEIRFYEINPLVPKIAAGKFHFLSCPAKSTITMGDARLSLEREARAGFDVLVVDAFTSDAIPVHLLTKEAMALYWKHLKADGVLAVHVSNQYIDLAPVVAAAAQESGKTARLVDDKSDAENAIDESHWVLVTSSDQFFSGPPLSAATQITTTATSVWTDDYSNLWHALK